IHDRLAASERHVKKFDPMLERWENGYLVRTRVVRQRVEVPVAVDSGEHDDVSSQWRRVRRIDYATYQEVMRLTEEGLGIHRIGKRLGISPQTVSNTRKMPPERVEKLRQLSQGDSGVDGGERKDEVNESKPQRKPQKIVDYEIYQKVMDMLNSGLSAYRISKELGFSQQTISNIRHMSPERVERLRRLYENGEQVRPCYIPTPFDGDTLQKIISIQKDSPNIPLSRLSALVGVSVYHLKKYLALSDAERDALLEALDEDATPVVNTASDVTATQSRTRKSRKGDDLNDPVFFSDDSDM
ncbi:helix-turn-helix domain-containing protein, partial [Escherichia coli]|nr:helix-turn-helix domain-containing protein [Escherichia coli]